MKVISYFHGFKGEHSSKAKQLQTQFPDWEVIDFIQSYDMEKDEQKFLDILMRNDLESVFLISSSLGAIYCMYFALKYTNNCILINPSYFPEITLKSIIQEDYLDNLLNIKHEIEMFEYNEEYFNLFLANDDERIDFDFFIDKFKDFNSIYRFDDKGHKFKKIKKDLPLIKEIIDKSSNKSKSLQEIYPC